MPRAYPILNQKGTDFMKGSCHFDKKANRWFVQIYWKGEKHRFWKHPVTGEPFWEKKSADKQLGKIQSQVDEGQFNPAYWKINSPISVDNYAEHWLDSIDVAPKTLKDYHSSVFNYIIPFFRNKGSSGKCRGEW
jgi:hypothetical protein